MKVLVACEFSGIVRDAIAARGHDAWLCDLLPCERSGKHLQSDVREVFGDGFDLMIAHPPCTHLAVSGARHFHRKTAEQAEALAFVRALADAPIPRICIENLVSVISTRLGRPTQVIQPWQFGHPEQKATCLWLYWLPMLRLTLDVKAQMLGLPRRERERNHWMSPGPERWSSLR